MRKIAIGIMGGCVALAATVQASAKPRPYEGVWASTKPACHSADGVDRMTIQGNRFDWYEAHCRASAVKRIGARSWTMRMACEGEGRRYRARPLLSLPAPGRLVMERAPVGPPGERRQVYVRCGEP